MHTRDFRIIASQFISVTTLPSFARPRINSSRNSFFIRTNYAILSQHKQSRVALRKEHFLGPSVFSGFNSQTHSALVRQYLLRLSRPMDSTDGSKMQANLVATQAAISSANTCSGDQLCRRSIASQEGMRNARIHCEISHVIAFEIPTGMEFA